MNDIYDVFGNLLVRKKEKINFRNPCFYLDFFCETPSKERKIKIIKSWTRAKNFEKSGLGIFVVENRYELRPISIPTKFKKLKKVPEKTKLFLDLNNNQYKISGVRAENVWKSGKAIRTKYRLSSKYSRYRPLRGKIKTISKITKK